ncbi:transposase [Azotobacter vinelandii CA]|uniref:Transposase n=2 Tax=Azotobacter vinelandii TaxID=354 RepID=C1DKX5_AZOVD|nr:transposase [Azotobacter vinelandii DJ]AGK14847.1 transposase [Azotobacter vinelandii CA]AGK20882.1 transposase [Azotobacter vinelandii CA6]
MEQVLDVYSRPHDPAHPMVCMDETPRQLIRQVREPSRR